MTATIVETNSTPFAAVDVDAVTVDIIENALKKRSRRDGRGAVPNRDESGHPRAGRLLSRWSRTRTARWSSASSAPSSTASWKPTTAISRKATSSSRTIPTCATRRCRTCRTGSCSCRSFEDGRHMAWSRDVRAHVGQRRHGARLDPDQGGDDLPGGHPHPPTKLYKKGELQSDVLELILHNVRTTEWNRFDLNALVAACRTAAKRCVEMAERFGDDVFLARRWRSCSSATYDGDASRSSRWSCPKSPQYFEDYVCDDGVGKGPYKIACKLWREGEQGDFRLRGHRPPGGELDQLLYERRDVQDVLRLVHDQPVRPPHPVQRRLLRTGRRPDSRTAACSSPSSRRRCPAARTRWGASSTSWAAFWGRARRTR